MTRINCIPVHQLENKFLLSEYREITRIPGNLRHALFHRKKSFSDSEIPERYTFGFGHVKYFFNKLNYLKSRYTNIVEELQKRGYKLQFTDCSKFNGLPEKYYNDWTPSKDDIKLNWRRVQNKRFISRIKKLYYKLDCGMDNFKGFGINCYHMNKSQFDIFKFINEDLCICFYVNNYIITRKYYHYGDIIGTHTVNNHPEREVNDISHIKFKEYLKEHLIKQTFNKLIDE